MGPTVALLIGRQPTERLSVHRGYSDAIWEVGAVPILFGPARGAAQLDRYLEEVTRCDAICVSGGGDLDPSTYGGVGEAPLMEVDPDRDLSELAAINEAMRAGLPLLGICRGIQTLAVASGGSLIQDLPAAGVEGHWQEERQYEPVHGIEADAGSIAGGVLAGVRLVNSIHHQAVASVGPNLGVTAWAPDGSIEAIEGAGMLGIQWHPERLFGADPLHLAPFRWLVEA